MTKADYMKTLAYSLRHLPKEEFERRTHKRLGMLPHHCRRHCPRRDCIMTKADYMKTLAYSLRHLPKEEFEQAMDYFEEYFAEAGPENEQQAIEDLGSPDEAAKALIMNLAAKNVEEPPKTVKHEEYFAEAGPENEQQAIEDLGSPDEAAKALIMNLAAKNVEEPPKTVKHSFKAVWIGLIALCAAPIALPLAFCLICVIAALIFAILCVLGGILLSAFCVAVWIGLIALCAAPIALPLAFCLICVIAALIFAILCVLGGILLSAFCVLAAAVIGFIGGIALLFSSFANGIATLGFSLLCAGGGVLFLFIAFQFCKWFLQKIVQFLGKLMKKKGAKHETNH